MPTNEGFTEEDIMRAKPKPAGTFDITLSWVSIVGLYLEVMERPEFMHHAQKRQAMKDAILRAAKLADLYVKEHK